MVRGHDDDERRQHRVHDREPSPTTRAERDDDNTDEHGPRDVHRRHRRELVGDTASHRAVHGLAVLHAGVDEADVGEHAGWSHGNHLHQQTRPRSDRDRVAHERIPRPVTYVQPHEERDGDGKVQSGVVEVAEPHDRRVWQHGVLHRQLARKMQHAFDVPHRLRVRDRARHPGDRQLRGALPQREQREHDRGLTREARRHVRARAVETEGHETDRGETGGEQCRGLPRDPEARHHRQSARRPARPTRPPLGSQSGTVSAGCDPTEPEEHAWT